MARATGKLHHTDKLCYDASNSYTFIPSWGLCYSNTGGVKSVVNSFKMITDEGGDPAGTEPIFNLLPLYGIS